MDKKPIIFQPGQPVNQRELRKVAVDLEAHIRTIPGHLGADPFPLKHQFGDGLYVREVKAPAGHLIVTKIHRFAHPFFLLEGECSIMVGGGAQRIKAPHYGMTPAGTKRVLFTHKDTVWVTVHATDEHDLEVIEKKIIADTIDEFDDSIEIKEFMKLAQE